MNKLKIPAGLKIFLWLTVSALLTSLTLQWDALWPISYLSMIPLFCLLVGMSESGRKARTIYRSVFLWMLFYHLSVYSFFWRMYPMEFMELTPIAAFFVVLFCHLGLSLFQALPMALLGPLFRLFYRHRKLSPILFASLWVILEWIQGFTWAGVPFLRLSLSQTSFLPAMQSASLFGSLFLSFLTAMINGCLGMGLYSFHRNGRACQAVRLFPLLGIGLITLNLGFGLARIAALSDSGEKSGVPVAMIQGNISSLDKWGDDSLSITVERHRQLISEAVEQSGAKIVLLPETALNFPILSDSYTKTRQLYSDLAKETGAILFIGTFTSDESEGETHDYNSVIAFFPDGSVEESPYSKRHLVPFGEYVPMKGLIQTILPFLADLNLFEGDLTPGQDSAILSTEYGKVGRLICFDSIYDRLTRESVRDGAEIILLSTNDSWYTDSAAVRMHNDHAKLRAVESGRYVLRAANTGISSLISPAGESLAQLGALKEGYVAGRAVFTSDRTLYSYIGNLIVLFCAAVPAFEAGCKIRERQKSRTAAPKRDQA